MITETPPPTLTPTASATPTATPNYWIEIPSPAGEPARISREGSIFEVVTVVLLLALIVSVWLMWFSLRLRDKANE